MRNADRILLKDAADNLSRGRKARLAGKTNLAAILEDRGQRQTESAVPNMADSLLTEWEGSLANHPLALPSWQEVLR